MGVGGEPAASAAGWS